MRTRRHFQPMVESMPGRIAPSAIGGLISPVVLAAAVAPAHSPQPTCMQQDTEMPDTGTSVPKTPPK
jgi:hypothetical protein